MWFVWWDPCGLFCYAFGWATIHFVNFALMTEVVWPWLGGTLHGCLHVLGFETLIVLICASYLRAACTDPGTVPQHSAKDEDRNVPADDPQVFWKPKRRFCDKCKCIKPPRAHHCSTCGRCVNKMDHHCPWVNNCVGSNNHKFFIQFLGLVFTGGVYTLVMSVARLLVCWRNPTECPDPSLYTIIMGVVSVILGLFFAIFTSAIFWDQWEGLVTNTTGIESMKRWEEEDRSLAEGMVDACGERCSVRWLLPTSMPPDAPSFYAWSPDDDPDAYDPRDPLVAKHFHRVEANIRGLEAMHKQAQQQQQAAQAHGRGGPVPVPVPDDVGLSPEDAARLIAEHRRQVAALQARRAALKLPGNNGASAGASAYGAGGNYRQGAGAGHSQGDHEGEGEGEGIEWDQSDGEEAGEGEAEGDQGPDEDGVWRDHRHGPRDDGDDQSGPRAAYAQADGEGEGDVPQSLSCKRQAPAPPAGPRRPSATTGSGAAAGTSATTGAGAQAVPSASGSRLGLGAGQPGLTARALGQGTAASGGAKQRQGLAGGAPKVVRQSSTQSEYGY